MWITAFAVFLLSALSGMGVGSAGLLVVWLTALYSTPQLTAQALNLLTFIASAGAGLTVHLFRTPILWKTLLLLLPFGVLGGMLGARLAAMLPREILRSIFGYMLIATGTLGLVQGKKSPTPEDVK